jgi:hypothetical protein
MRRVRDIICDYVDFRKFKVLIRWDRERESGECARRKREKEKVVKSGKSVKCADWRFWRGRANQIGFGSVSGLSHGRAVATTRYSVGE